MTIFEINQAFDTVTLMSSHSEILADQTVLISLHFDVALIKLKSTNLISVSKNCIDIYVDKQNIILNINEGCETAIEELQNFFADASNYE
ncbi:MULTISPECIES: hypothetical protein [unclassified Acinetobacter]|uniref:hypothetical protein n=1 Tax=unclassified Acinetobacter TaxID=196816 RepID=UPI001C243E2E|nr:MULTISPECIES: hypothetical protein [unclassified Acinetobacter]